MAGLAAGGVHHRDEVIPGLGGCEAAVVEKSLAALSPVVASVSATAGPAGPALDGRRVGSMGGLGRRSGRRGRRGWWFLGRELSVLSDSCGHPATIVAATPARIGAGSRVRAATSTRLRRVRWGDRIRAATPGPVPVAGETGPLRLGREVRIR